MKKIPTIFEREVTGKRAFATPVWLSECEWVRNGEGVATRKTDGSACLIHNRVLYKRLEWDAGKGPAPSAWLHHSFDPEQRSGHGWFPVGEGPDDWMHRLVLEQATGLADGTYELCGPKMGKNKEKLDSYKLIRHGDDVVGIPRDFDGIKAWLQANEMEGVVWHHADGRMAKIKRRDFGLPW